MTPRHARILGRAVTRALGVRAVLVAPDGEAVAVRVTEAYLDGEVERDGTRAARGERKLVSDAAAFEPAGDGAGWSLELDGVRREIDELSRDGGGCVRIDLGRTVQ